MVKVNVSPPRERVVTITMKESEAETLRIIFQRIGGHDVKSRRSDIDAIEHSLENAGVKLLPRTCLDGSGDRGMIFKNREDEDAN